MSTDYWVKQSATEPLFSDLLWSRPEHTAQAGKLLIVGGNGHGFLGPAEAYTHALKAGAGTIRVMLPDAVHKLAGAVLPQVEFAPSTPSGSFSQKATAEIIAASAWADGTLLAGNFGQNSETAVLLESVTTKQPGQITITDDAADILIQGNTPLPETNCLYVLTMPQLQKLATRLHVTEPIISNMALLQLVDSIHALTTDHDLGIIVKHLDQYIAACGGRVSTSKSESDSDKWQVRAATYASIWWLQNPTRPLEALTTAMYELTDKSG